ncbi:MAG TPA: hypothetical protein VGA71_17400 [Actinomycetota bacterium]
MAPGSTSSVSRCRTVRRGPPGPLDAAPPAEPRRRADALTHRVKAAVGNRIVATGWRLLEAGLPHTR